MGAGESISCGSGEYRYAAAMRPVDSFTVPRGFTRLDTASDDVRHIARHGVVVYDRPLTAGELTAFELVLLADARGDAELAALVVQELGEYAVEYAKAYDTDPEMVEEAVLEALQRCVPFQVHPNSRSAFSGAVVRLVNETIAQGAGTLPVGEA